jgi:hypothetical protein
MKTLSNGKNNENCGELCAGLQKSEALSGDINGCSVAVFFSDSGSDTAFSDVIAVMTESYANTPDELETD